MDGHEQNASPMDPVALAKLKELGGEQKPGEPDIVTSIIDLFLTETPKRLRDAQDAYKDENLPKLELSAHSIKGSCAILGLHAMIDVCQQIENASHNRLSAPVKPLLDQLEHMLSDAEPWLVKERDSEPSET